MSQQQQADGLQERAVQALEEIRREDTTEYEQVLSGKLAAEAYNANKRAREDKITATEDFVERATRLNTLTDRTVALGDQIRKPKPRQALTSQDGGVQGDADPAEFQAQGDRLSAQIDRFLEHQPGVREAGGPIMARGSRARSLLNKAFRHGRNGKPIAPELEAYVTLSKEDWEFLYKPRIEQLMNPYVDRDGGFVTAEEMRNEMISLRTLAIGLSSRFRQITTNAATVSFPTANVIFNFQKRDRTGQGAITPLRLTDVFGKTMFQPAGRDVILKVPEELVEDATFDLVSFLAEEANRISDEEDERLGIEGTGSGEPLGYLTGLVKLYDSITAPSGTEIGIDPGNDGSLTFTGADINEEYIQIFDTYVLPASGRANAVWTGPPQFERRVRLFRGNEGGANTGEFMFKRALEAGAPNTLNSYPLLTSQFFPNNFDSGSAGDPLFHFGDLRDYWWVTRSGLRLRVLAELYAETSEIGYKWQKRQDGALVRADANIFARHQ